jgi:hypothetical protein
LFRQQPWRALRDSEGSVRNSGSPAFVSTTGPPIVQLVFIKQLTYGNCRGISLINDDHPLFQRQPSIFGATRYCSAVCSYGLCRRGNRAQDPPPPGQGHDSQNTLTILPIRRKWVKFWRAGRLLKITILLVVTNSAYLLTSNPLGAYKFLKNDSAPWSQQFSMLVPTIFCTVVW